MSMEKKLNENMDNGNEIEKLMVEIETYRQAIQDAKDALESAERELDDALASEMESEGWVPVGDGLPFPEEEGSVLPGEDGAAAEEEPDRTGSKSGQAPCGKRGKIIPFVRKERITVRIENETYARAIRKAEKALRKAEEELDGQTPDPDEAPF